MAQKKPGGLVLYFDHIRFSRFLSDEDRGKLILCLADYAEVGTLPDSLSGASAICFEMMREAIDRNNERYAEACERNRAKANKRWGNMPNDATACHGMPQHTSAYKTMPSDAEHMPSDADDANLNLNLNGTESVIKGAGAPPARKKRFAPPTEEECQAFFTEKGWPAAEATRFFCYYTSNGWRTGKNPMKDWQAAARGWISRNQQITFPTTNEGGNRVLIDN